MKKIIYFIQNIFKEKPDITGNFIISIIVIFLLSIIHFVIIKIVWRETEDVHKRYYWRKITTYVLIGIGIFILGRLWFKGFQSIATYLGLLSAGIAIALKDVLTNFAGWIFILSRQPFKVGDRIQVGEHAGDVIDIRIFQFTLLEIGNWVASDQSTGRMINIPNGRVITDVLANYSKGFRYIWNELPVIITFESDWKKAKNILLKIANRHAEKFSKSVEKKIKEASQKYLIFYSKLTPIIYTNVQNNGVLLTIRYLCQPKQRRESEQAIWEDILQEFAKYNDIDFAYPTQRFYNNYLEKNKKYNKSQKNEILEK